MNVSSATATASTLNSSDSATNPLSQLKEKDFLQLLVTQLQNQNPLDPKSDTDMAAQMAQFTSLQQSSQMSSSMAMMQADSLVGNTVTIQINSQLSTSGVVSGVILENGAPKIVVDGASYDLNQVTSVSPTVISPSSSTAN